MLYGQKERFYHRVNALSMESFLRMIAEQEVRKKWSMREVYCPWLKTEWTASIHLREPRSAFSKNWEWSSGSIQHGNLDLHFHPCGSEICQWAVGVVISQHIYTRTKPRELASALLCCALRLKVLCLFILVLKKKNPISYCKLQPRCHACKNTRNYYLIIHPSSTFPS